MATLPCFCCLSNFCPISIVAGAAAVAAVSPVRQLPLTATAGAWLPIPLPFISLSLVWRNLVCLCRGCCRISRTVILIATHLSACATRRMRDLRPSSTRLDWQALRLMGPESVSDLFKATQRQSQEFIRNPSHLPQKVCCIISETRSPALALSLPLSTTGRMSVLLARIKQPFSLD